MTDMGELDSKSLMIVSRSGLRDHLQYFAGIDLVELRTRQEKEMREIGGSFDEAADRISQIVHFCEPASYRKIFLPASAPDANWQALYEPLTSSPEGKSIKRELEKRHKEIEPKYINSLDSSMMK